MYTLNKGPSKIVSQTRRGLPQNFEKFESIKESYKKNDNFNFTRPKEHGNIPRPVFHKSKGETMALKLMSPIAFNENATITPHHEEIIRYINESWNTLVAETLQDSLSDVTVEKQLENLISTSSSLESIVAHTPSSSCTAVWIEPPSPELNDFKPFDLEAWWGQRLFQNITQNL